MRKSTSFVAAVLLFATPVSADGQLVGDRNKSGCVKVAGTKSPITAEGRLSLRHMPGPPNFENIRLGDKDMLTLILTLPRSVCIDDGGDFADPKKHFRTVHVWSSDARVRNQLKGAVGKRVAISGEGYAADNAMHFAPLVLEAKRLNVR